MVNGAIPIIAMGDNGLGCNQPAETRHADRSCADRCKQMIARSALVIHNLKKHMNYQFIAPNQRLIRYQPSDGSQRKWCGNSV
jgi:hypothetical protein